MGAIIVFIIIYDKTTPIIIVNISLFYYGSIAKDSMIILTVKNLIGKSPGTGTYAVGIPTMVPPALSQDDQYYYGLAISLASLVRVLVHDNYFNYHSLTQARVVVKMKFPTLIKWFLISVY